MAHWISTFFGVIIVLQANPVIGYHNLADVPCGRGEFNGRSPRVVGGQDAIPREFPWLVSITRLGGHFCAGTILTTKFILTAAHCLCTGTSSVPVRQLRVTLGEHNLKEAEVPAAREESVRNVVVHPEHKCGLYMNDVALLEMVQAITWSESVKPACLPMESGEPGYRTFEGESAVVAGWGWLGEDRSRYKRADTLQKVDVRVVESEVCSEWYESQGKKSRVKSGQMCAGHEEGGRDSCWADSGGPLMIGNKSTETMVIGVVSSGIGCARRRLPGLYARVSEYIPWIVDQVK